MKAINPNDPDLAECIGHWTRSRWGKRKLEDGKRKLAEAAKQHAFARMAREADAETTLMVAGDAAESGRAVEMAKLLGDRDLLRVLEAM